MHPRGYRHGKPRRDIRWLKLSLGVLLIMPVLQATAAQEETLRMVMARAGTYIGDYRRQMSSIVTEEHYLQEVSYQGGHPAPADVQPESRELRSDLLLVKPAGARDWLQLRDVFEVDGLPVVERSERLTKLLDESSPFSENVIARIMSESARYNIGPIQRTVNAPLLPLMFLEPSNQGRFKFKRTIDRRPAMARDEPAPPGYFRVSTEVWVVEYRETEPGTFIRTPGRKDLPSHGRFWIEPTTGRVLMSELINGDREVRATIDVSYQSEPLVGFLVPVEMREQYEGRRDGVRITGTATYGRFRQAQVAVDRPSGVVGK
jgi:hypothetical protein